MRDVIVAALVGVSVGIISGHIVADNQSRIDDRRSARELDAAELLAKQAIWIENIRFLREQLARPDTDKQLSFGGLDISRQTFGRADLTKRAFPDTVLIGSTFNGTTLEEAVLEGANLTDSSASAGSWERIEGWGIIANGLRTEFVDFSGADLEGAELKGASFDSTLLRDVNLKTLT